MLSQELMYIFFPLLFVVAFLYASVGHGGASGYLALMGLFGISAAIMKPSALILNIFVSCIAFIQYYRAGYFRWTLFLPFILLSIPASFIGAYITLDDVLYKKILGVLLIFPIVRLMGVVGKQETHIRALSWPLAMVIGAIIGLVSGMIGIGGGIILSPVILFLHWADMKQTAAVSALFICCNSISGLAGLLSKGTVISDDVYWYLLFATGGGLLGSYFATKQFNDKVLRFILGFVLIIASVKLLTLSN